MTSDQVYIVGEGLVTTDTFSVQQLPQTCYSETFTTTSTPDASSFVTLDSVTSNFAIQTSSTADVNIFSLTITATIPLETSTGSGINMSISSVI